MLSNAYLLAKFRFDTAENEPAKNLQNFANFPILLILRTLTPNESAGRGGRGPGRGRLGEGDDRGLAGPRGGGAAPAVPEGTGMRESIESMSQ